jgi:hypothetical protein
MSHFGTSVRVQGTDLEWLKTGSQIGHLVNEWSEREDLVAYVGERAGSAIGAPAAFNPASAEVDVNTKIAFGFATPEMVGDLRVRTQQFEFPKATGAIFHEACHARFSTWSLADAQARLTPAQFKAMIVLEETRIESLGVKTMPENRAFLRACALEIVLGDMNSEESQGMSTTRQAAQTMALAYARVDAGVLEASDIDPIRPVVEKIVRADIREALRDVWREFQNLRPTYDLERMYELAIEWDRLVQEQAEENGDSQGSSEGDEGEMMEALGKALAEALEEAAEEASFGAQEELDDQQTQEEYDSKVEETNNKSQERRDHKELAKKIFSKGTGPDDHRTSSTLYETRKPTAEERVSAVKIGQALDKAKYRDRVRIESASVTPPGRLRTRALVQANAYKERGVFVETEPWNRIQRKHTEDPNLTIGVMVDISGSMSSAMKPMASAAWILSEATRRIQGKVAMVYYGSAVFPTLKPGQHMTDVKVYTAPDGTERFDEAFKVLDGSLNLLNSSGARLLVVVSDGEYTNPERDATRKWLNRCSKEGVGVLWLSVGHYSGRAERRYGDGNDVQFLELGESVTDAANAIGKAASTALTKAGERRNA